MGRRGRPPKKVAISVPENEVEFVPQEPIEIILKMRLYKKDVDKDPELKEIFTKNKAMVPKAIVKHVERNVQQSEFKEKEVLSKNTEEKIRKLENEIDKKNSIMALLQNENQLLKDIIEKNIGKKIEYIPLKGNIIHKNEKISVIEKNRELVCFHCTCSFENDPCFIPETYNKATNTYQVFGHFCSFGCAAKYNIGMGDFDSWNRNSLLTKLFYECASLSGVDTTGLVMQEAPPREMLIQFGGPLTIEEFRKRSMNPNRDYVLVQPFMVQKRSYIEDIHKKQSLFKNLKMIK